MKQLSPKNQRWLKGFHSLFACMWVGAAIVLSVKQFFVNPSTGRELYGITSTMDFIDIVIIIPGALGFFSQVSFIPFGRTGGGSSTTGLSPSGSYACTE